MNINITLDKNLLNDEDYDFFHYEQSYELAKCEFGTFYIVSRGELNCTYIDEEKDIDTSDYDDIVRYYVKNNKEYENAIDNCKLVQDMNNWFSIEFFDNNEEFIEDNCFIDSVYGSISECLQDFQNIIKNDEIMEEFKNDIDKWYCLNCGEIKEEYESALCDKCFESEMN